MPLFFRNLKFNFIFSFAIDENLQFVNIPVLQIHNNDDIICRKELIKLKNSDSLQTVVRLIENSIKKNRNSVYHVFKKELIDSRKMTNAEVDRIMNIDHLDEVNTNVLVWVYSALRMYNQSLPEVEDFFTDIEIENSKNFIIKRYQSAFPVKFPITRISLKNEFKTVIPIQELCSLVNAGVIVIVDNLQREQQFTMYGGMLVSHVKYNDKVARDIGSCICRGEYWNKDDIGLHLITDENCRYDISEDEITIRSGKIALIDGNHRTNGFQYALLENPEIDMKVSVYLTIGTIEDGQEVLAQHEMQQPINKKLIQSYKKSDANDIFRLFSEDIGIKRRYKFVDTADAERAGIGFFVKADMTQALAQYYDLENMTINEQDDVAEWLISYFMTLYDLLEHDIINYKTVRKNKWSVRTNAVYVYVCISSMLYGNTDWREVLRKLINKIDFNDMTVYKLLTSKQTVRNIIVGKEQRYV